MIYPTNGHKNAPQPRPASPAPITPPSRTTHPVVQSLQVLALYAALVAVVCLLVTTCSPATAQTIAPRHDAGYAGPARESDGPVLTGRFTEGAQPAHGLFSCVAAGRPRPHGMAGWEAARLAGYLSFRSVNPSSLAAQMTDSGKASFIKKGAAHHVPNQKLGPNCRRRK